MYPILNCPCNCWLERLLIAECTVCYAVQLYHCLFFIAKMYSTCFTISDTAFCIPFPVHIPALLLSPGYVLHTIWICLFCSSPSSAALTQFWTLLAKQATSHSPVVVVSFSLMSQRTLPLIWPIVCNLHLPRPQLEDCKAFPRSVKVTLSDLCPPSFTPLQLALPCPL